MKPRGSGNRPTPGERSGGPQSRNVGAPKAMRSAGRSDGQGASQGTGHQSAPPARLFSLPLYRGLGFFAHATPFLPTDQTPVPAALASAHAGLLYDKYVDAWTIGSEGTMQPPAPTMKGEFLDRFLKWYESGKRAAGSVLSACLNRQEQLVRSLGGALIEASTHWRLVAGLGNGHPLETGLLWHPILGLPYYPGSSVKGLTRAWADKWGAVQDPREVDRLFGDQSTTGAGTLVVFDALPLQVPNLELDIFTPHYPEYYREPQKPPADCQEPVPIPFLAVAPRQRFRFALAPCPSSAGPQGRAEAAAQADLRAGVSLLKDALEIMGAGGKTAVGYGVFTDVRVTLCSTRLS